MSRRKSRKEFAPEQGLVRDVTAEGNGVIGSEDGKTVFVDGALKGEEIVFKRRKQKRRYDEADLLEVLKPSPDRVTPKCAYFLNCGGCTWQHLGSEQQILIKQEALLQAFSRIGGVAPAAVMLTDPFSFLPDLLSGLPPPHDANKSAAAIITTKFFILKD